MTIDHDDLAGPGDARMQELLRRNLQEVFGEGDARRRRAAIDALYLEDAVLYAPPGAIVGRDAIDRFAGELRARHPAFVYTERGAGQTVQNGGRLAWGSGLPDSAPAYTGWDVIIVRNNRIAALYVFLDDMSLAHL